MKNLIFGIALSIFISVGSIISVNAGLNLPDEKKKKCSTTENKDCKKDGKKKSCCEGKTDGKNCDKKKSE